MSYGYVLSAAFTDGAIQHVLREANRNTLDEVTSFLEQAAEADTYVKCIPLDAK